MLRKRIRLLYSFIFNSLLVLLLVTFKVAGIVMLAIKLNLQLSVKLGTTKKAEEKI